MEGNRFIDDIGKTVQVLGQLSDIAVKFVPTTPPPPSSGLGDTTHNGPDGFFYRQPGGIPQETRTVLTLAGLAAATGIIVYFTRNTK